MNKHDFTPAPAMFIGHGSPVFAVEPGRAGELLTAYRKHLSGIRGALIISPHWITRGLEITAGEELETIHDFGGFPQELYQLQYPAPSSPALADEVIQSLSGAGYKVTANKQRGRDHGVWVPLLHLLPDADIPVLQLSLDGNMASEDFVNLGKALQSLRQAGILIIASGALTHNLYDIRRDGSSTAAYAERFEAWVRESVQQRDIASLSAPYLHQDDFERAHPTADHYVPLLIAIGASTDTDQLTVLDGGVCYGSISMESYGWH